MSSGYGELKNYESMIPNDFPGNVVDTIKRVINNPFVLGVMFFRRGTVEMCTVPLNMIPPLSVELPQLTELIKTALGEVDILDELKGYRIRTKHSEIEVVVDNEIVTCAVVKLKKKDTSTYKRKHH